MELLNHIHSILRYGVLIFGVLSVLFALKGMLAKSNFGKTDNLIAILLVISCHIQLVTGLLQYVLGAKGLKNIQNIGMGSVMKDSYSRFFAVEHISVMLIAIILITIGRSKSKRALTDTSKHKISFWFYFIGLILILSRIPWPFMAGFQNHSWF